MSSLHYCRDSTSALFSLLQANSVDLGQTLLIPDYYCEEVSLSLSQKWNVITYPLLNSLYPDFLAIQDLLELHNISAIIVLCPFNLFYDFSFVSSRLSPHQVTTIYDCAHSFPVFSQLTDFPYQAIFSLRKPFNLSEGSVIYLPDDISCLSLSKSSISLDISRLALSVLKIFRLILCIIFPAYYIHNFGRLLTNYFLPSHPKPFTYKEQFSIDLSIDLFDFILLSIFSSHWFYSLLGNRLFCKNYPTSPLHLHKHYCLGFLSSDNSSSLQRNTIKWPTPIYSNYHRSRFWSKNASCLYDRFFIHRSF